MIKILKPGKTIKFTKTCPKCECEFEYDEEDVEVDYSLCLTTYPPQYHRYIRCPHCGERIYHDTKSDGGIRMPNVIYTTTQKIDNDSCEGCSIYEQAKKGILGVNDACYWCSKNKYRVTCGTGICSDKGVTTTYATYCDEKDYKKSVEEFQKDL